MGKIIAAYGGGFKPPTKGHFEVVKTALAENPEIDEFVIYVGSKERNEITQAESILIWDTYKQYLPLKVRIEPSKSPIGDIIRLIKNNPEDTVYFILGSREGNEEDQKDFESRTQNLQSKYDNVAIKLITTPDMGISGTNARKASKSSFEDFVKFLPADLINTEKEGIYDIVRNIISEAIVGKKIECDGCDWSWNIKDGGDDLFICHKCGHDNTPMLNENASYSKNINIQEKIDQLTQHMLDKGYNIEPLPTVEFVDGDVDNATQFLGKTAYYDPNERKIVLYTEGRHPKDIVRSYSHEMIHHIQNLEGRLGDITTTNTQEDDELNKIEAEANLKGTMTFRNWTDSLNEDIGNPPGGEYDVNWLHDMVMQGKKDLHFLVTKHPMVNTQTEINLLKIYENMPDFKILKVDKKDGDAWIAYRNTPTGKNKAKRLKEIADSHGGYLNDKTPDEAREIGKLLDYSPADTEKYIKRRYNLNESEEQQLNVFGGDAAPESQPKMPFEERLEYYKNYYTNVSPSIFDVATENGTIVIGGLDKSYPKDFNDVDDTRQVPVDESEKPYKHKHGFDDKLGNDPFGLNQYARELAQGLEEEILSEGKYDKLANIISRTAFTFFKEIHDSGKTEGKTKISVGEDGDIPSDQFEFDLELYVEITDDLYQPDGGANAGYDEEGDEIQPLLNIAFKIPKNPVWSTISMDLKDIARHELEHLTQDGENLRPGKYMQDDQLARDLIDAEMLPKSQYFKLEKEVDAMLQGLYYRAKKEKLPFKDVINNYFQRVGLSKEDQKVILKIWRSRRGALSLPIFENK